MRPLGSVARIYRSRRGARVRRAPSATPELRSDPVAAEPCACVAESGAMTVGVDGAQSMVRPLGSVARIYRSRRGARGDCKTVSRIADRIRLRESLQRIFSGRGLLWTGMDGGQSSIFAPFLPFWRHFARKRIAPCGWRHSILTSRSGYTGAHQLRTHVVEDQGPFARSASWWHMTS